MKPGWEVRPLGEVAEIINGGTPKSKVAEYWGGQVQWLTPKDMGQLTDPRVSETPRTITEEGLSRSSARLSPRHSVILSTRAPIGHLAINEVPMAFNQGCRAVVAGETLDYQYVYYFLMANKAELNERGTGTTFKELSSTNLKSLPILLPPLEEQRRIVAVLDEAFEGLNRARENTETNLTNARELFESVLADVFADKNVSWVHKSLSQIGKTSTGSTPKASQPENWGAELPFVTPSDFRRDGTLNYRNRGLSELGAAQARLIPANSALMVCIGATIGKTGWTDREISMNQQVNALEPMDGSSGEYLYFQMLTQAFQKSVLANSGQATLPIINKRKWSGLKVSVPEDPRHQEPIVKKLRGLNNRLSELEIASIQKLTDLEDLRQSLLQKAFAGELT